ncbi:BON domain-containing protein [Methylibium sp.]|uniref:BON domain-containing protein n=1 Tax=Methylibium sp. TaxID=2067992 RepID=UPI003D0FDF54
MTSRLTPSPSTRSMVLRVALAALVGTSLAGALGGCALLIGGAAVGSAMMYSDRRTSGTQIEDQGIELKGATRIKETIGERGRVSLTSFNRTVLLTGDVPTEADKTAVEAAIARLENVRSTLNELVVGPALSLGDRSNDALITSKVKASYVDARDIFANAYKVVTDRGVVYLMGRVTDREADRGVAIARGVSGVVKVVKAFEIITEAELAQTVPKEAPKTSPSPAR